MNLNDWWKRDDLQLLWKQTWESEHMVKGLEVLKNVALPAYTTPPTGCDVIDHNALMNSRREGYYDVLRNIENLKETKTVNNELPQGWDNVKKED